MSGDPHGDGRLIRGGAALDGAAGAVVLLHGRGATAEGILGLGRELGRSDLALLAPQAAGGAWYPQSFLAPLEANEPWLSSAVRAATRAVAVAEAAGVPRERVVLAGFSQGACLACETVARHAGGGRWGGLVALSGGLIGTGPAPPAAAPPGAAPPGAAPPGAAPLRALGRTWADQAFDYAGSLAGVPAFVGCSDVDPHIPPARVERTAAVLRSLGADVDLRVYPGFGHAVNADEVDAARDLLARAVPAA